jgi:ABC-type multidrug transport system fused ATPase/permease subunit
MDLNPRHKSVEGMRRVKLRYFAIALVPISIFWLNGMIVDHFFPNNLAVPKEFLQEGNDWLEAVGRYKFLAATFFFAAISMLAVALLACNLARPTTPGTRAAAIATLLVILVLAVIPTVRHIITLEGSGVYNKVGGALFEAALSRGTLPGCLVPDDYWLLGRCGENPVISMFERVMDFVNVFAGLSVGALIVGMILCLETRDGDDSKEAAELLVENLRQMRLQLYLSSLILTFGMFFAASWMHWPLPMILDAEREAYRSIVLATALFTGTYFCLLILSFYLPVAMIIDSRIVRLGEIARQGGPKKEELSLESWREKRGLTGSASDYMRAGLAITAPIFAAYAGGISPMGL